MQQAFYKQQAMPFQEKEYHISKRFQKDGTPLLWRLKGISQLENEEIWKKSGQNPKQYEMMALATSVVYPDLRKADLQDSYHVMGAENLLTKMLLAGEWEVLQEAAEDVNQ